MKTPNILKLLDEINNDENDYEVQSNVLVKVSEYSKELVADDNTLLDYLLTGVYSVEQIALDSIKWAIEYKGMLPSMALLDYEEVLQRRV